MSFSDDSWLAPAQKFLYTILSLRTLDEVHALPPSIFDVGFHVIRQNNLPAPFCFRSMSSDVLGQHVAHPSSTVIKDDEPERDYFAEDFDAIIAISNEDDALTLSNPEIEKLEIVTARELLGHAENVQRGIVFIYDEGMIHSLIPEQVHPFARKANALSYETNGWYFSSAEEAFGWDSNFAIAFERVVLSRDWLSEMTVRQTQASSDVMILSAQAKPGVSEKDLQKEMVALGQTLAVLFQHGGLELQLEVALSAPGPVIERGFEPPSPN